MTPLPSSSSGSSSGPYGYRDIRSLYPVITENHLRYLKKWGLIRQEGGLPGAGSRSGPDRDERVYSFADLQIIKSVAAELQRGTPLKTILRSLLASRQGQLQLDFHATTDTPRPKVLTLQPRRHQPPRVAPPAPLPAAAAFPFSDPQSALAAKYFLEGSRLDDGDEKKMEQAAAAYRKALVIDPDLVPAIVNLANIHYAHDELIEAQALYERAIGLDPDCFEAHFNLGNIQHDLGRYHEALVSYRAAVALNPSYPDAHFYLAVTLEKSGQSAEAKAHWNAYKELAPHGEWIELAREFSE